MSGFLTACREEDFQSSDVRQPARHEERFAVVGVPVHDYQTGEALGRFVVLGAELTGDQEEAEDGHATRAEAHVVLGRELVFEDQGVGVNLVTEFAGEGEEREDLRLAGAGAGAEGEGTGGCSGCSSCSCCFQRVGDVVVLFGGGGPDVARTGRHGEKRW